MSESLQLNFFLDWTLTQIAGRRLDEKPSLYCYLLTNTYNFISYYLKRNSLISCKLTHKKWFKNVVLQLL